jgi:hypothetical protein
VAFHAPGPQALGLPVAGRQAALQRHPFQQQVPVAQRVDRQVQAPGQARETQRGGAFGRRLRPGRAAAGEAQRRGQIQAFGPQGQFGAGQRGLVRREQQGGEHVAQGRVEAGVGAGALEPRVGQRPGAARQVQRGAVEAPAFAGGGPARVFHPHAAPGGGVPAPGGQVPDPAGHRHVLQHQGAGGVRPAGRPPGGQGREVQATVGAQVQAGIAPRREAPVEVQQGAGLPGHEIGQFDVALPDVVVVSPEAELVQVQAQGPVGQAAAGQDEIQRNFRCPHDAQPAVDAPVEPQFPAGSPVPGFGAAGQDQAPLPGQGQQAAGFQAFPLQAQVHLRLPAGPGRTAQGDAVAVQLQPQAPAAHRAARLPVQGPVQAQGTGRRQLAALPAQPRGLQLQVEGQREGLLRPAPGGATRRDPARQLGAGPFIPPGQAHGAQVNGLYVQVQRPGGRVAGRLPDAVVRRPVGAPGQLQASVLQDHAADAHAAAQQVHGGEAQAHPAQGGHGRIAGQPALGTGPAFPYPDVAERDRSVGEIPEEGEADVPGRDVDRHGQALVEGVHDAGLDGVAERPGAHDPEGREGQGRDEKADEQTTEQRGHGGAASPTREAPKN